MGRDNNDTYNEAVSLSARSRPQYHYFYGSTEGGDNIGNEIPDIDNEDSLFGEELVPTDREDEPPANSERDLPHLIITNGDSSKPPPRDRPYPIGLVPISILILGVVMFLVVVFPNASDPMPAYGFVPYTHVDRSAYDDSVGTFIALDLFHPTLLSDTIPRTFNFPFPTGAFWTNLVVLPDDNNQSYPITVYPYAYKWAGSYLQLSYPAARRVAKKSSIRDAFEPDITIATQEGAQNRFITKFDPLSVTLRFISSPESKWETSLVQGSPYATIKVLNSTPIFTPLSTFKSVQCPGDDNEKFGDFTDNEDEGWRRRLFGVCSIDESDKNKSTIRGVQFIFKTAEGLSWIMFSSEPMNLVFDTARKTTIKSSAPFTGIIRLAHIPEMNSNETVSGPNEKTAESSTGLRRLIYHAGIYPTGGQVSWEFHSPLSSATGTTSQDQKTQNNGRHATVTFNYATQTMLDTSHIPNEATKPLLMLALPHHADVLSPSVMLKSKKFDLQFHSIKGPLTPVVGSTWSYTEPLFDIGVDGPFQEIDPKIRRQLLEQIDDDLGQLLPTSAENIYGFGKQIARLAQLTHISKKLHKDVDQNSGFRTGIPEKGTALLSNYLEMFLSSQVTDKLVFDSNLGGLVSSNGLLDTSEDFGNGRYNDHHFHYGYILYACAIMGRIDPSFLDRFGPSVDAIFHDVAHPLNSDSRTVQPSNLFFPLARHKSWFDGHSFATGVFPFATGKSQESSSEAVNCYYGAYLWSLVRHGGSNAGSDLTDFTRLLLAMEIRSTKIYWHMIPATATNTSHSSQIYTAEFQGNYMVGKLGMLDVEATTSFGDQPLYAHVINTLPITAVTAKLFNEDYVQYEYPFLIDLIGEVAMAWRGYTVSLHAIIDPAAAWEDALELVSWELDSALSKSQVLYWICQRPGFANTIDAVRAELPLNNVSLSLSLASCDGHSQCIATGVSGLCCPTEDGAFLECCHDLE